MKQSKSNQPHFSEIQYVHNVKMGSIDPQNPLSDSEQQQQVKLLNRCLNDYPKGVILGRDISIATFQLGEHQINMQMTTYHIGFTRTPYWLAKEQNK